jgi:hypothetical protein
VSLTSVQRAVDAGLTFRPLPDTEASFQMTSVAGVILSDSNCRGDTRLKVNGETEETCNAAFRKIPGERPARPGSSTATTGRLSQASILTEKRLSRTRLGSSTWRKIA